MRLSVIGAGYVGLVTTAVFAELGNEVTCIDIDKEKIARLKRGKIPFFEPELEEYVQRNLKEKRLSFDTSYKDVANSQVVFICVGTPGLANGEADLSYLFSAVEATTKHISRYTVIAIKSTIPVGFEDDLFNLAKKHTRAQFEFASCPEFLREGSAIADTLNPDRIVIGTDSQKARQILLELHEPISGQRIITNMRSAQLIKYAANAFLATKISFANLIANLSEKVGADVNKVLEGVGADSRIGSHFLSPGVGYGGSCLPKDVLAFIATGEQFGYSLDLLRAVDAINNAQIERFVSKIRQALGREEATGRNLAGVHLAILGLSFKPNTDDIRDAPSIKIAGHLIDLGAQITAYDPQAMENVRKILPQINYAASEYQAVKDKDAMIVLTEWPQFRELSLAKVKKLLKNPVIIDGRNIYDRAVLLKLGFKYFCLGR